MMNAAQHPDPQTLQAPWTAVAPSGAHAPGRSGAVSAWVDGEIDDADLDALLQACGEPVDVHDTWHSYQVIGDVLRGSKPAATVVPPQAFLAGVRSRLQAEPVLSEPVSLRAQVRAPASNDAVFRWKLVSGVASLAAVLAVSWSVISGGPLAPSGAGPQLALMPAAPVSVAVGGGAAAVLVSTEQGTVVRDARLEKLMAEHRQHGGMSALQRPAGFLRDATYDATPTR